MTSELVVRTVPQADEALALLAPSVGIFAADAHVGELVSPGEVIGTIEVLGVASVLRCPAGVTGRIVDVVGDGIARVPVQYGDVFVVVSVAADLGGSVDVDHDDQAPSAGLAFVAPMSGRFYSRPSPDEPRFAGEGDTVTRGQTVGLLEVMKTFNRLVYQGSDLPDSAVIRAVAPADGDDVVRGDVILTLEPVGGD